jgi:endothelin-converting enzyme/putative endopeptidase
MTRSFPAVLLLSLATIAFAQQNPNPAQQATPAQEQKPAVAKPEAAPPPKVTPRPDAAAPAADRPLAAIPYTPSLDIPSMDRTAEPCVDFHQYACGGWIVRRALRVRSLFFGDDSVD